MSEPSAELMHHVGHKFHELFQIRQGCYADLPAAKISEMMKSNSLDVCCRCTWKQNQVLFCVLIKLSCYSLKIW
ncbi:hypothetical protein RchiOBHm_Chr2g0159711 [Rosa chinensis]|uniref:Uncharacterized protein n=1 Tax=Rosa chinensis TaxID=74649 RepID=A0A2P6S2D0_ROSCH|nr:hypothetical protein RchiOBHm_Chr2g0159711 [Rosa chinensis]